MGKPIWKHCLCRGVFQMYQLVGVPIEWSNVELRNEIIIWNGFSERLHTLGSIECEQPRADLYAFNGRLELIGSMLRDPPAVASDVARDSSRALPLTSDHLLLRGSRIKNTEWAIGCAVYTGQNTKLAMNSCITRSKISSSETYINKFLVFFLVILISMVTVSYFMKRYVRKDYQHFARSKNHFVFIWVFFLDSTTCTSQDITCIWVLG